MRIAICDDEPVHLNSIKTTLQAYNELPKDTKISEYTNGLTLLEGYNENPFDIVFLDIEMDGISGLEAGQKLRDIDKKLIIVLVSGYEEYMRQSFKIEVFDYIVKPFDDEEIYGVLNRALKKYYDQHHKIELKWKDINYLLNIGDIVYIEIDNRHLKVVTQSNDIKCLGKLDYYDNLLSPYGFFRCHKSFLVNMAFISSIDGKKITTIYNNELYISVRKKRECISAFNEFASKYRI